MKNIWSKEEIQKIYNTPLLDLIYKAAAVHRIHHHSEIQVCSLVSIKTGGCPENCKYCPQSAHYKTNVRATPLMEEEEILEAAKNAIANGVTRICLGAAWRSIREGVQFNRILKVIKKISELQVEVCCTLGFLNETQARKLKEAGLYAYNHNLDTSSEFYPTIITTRKYEERLRTLDIVAHAGLNVCCGGIIGMGETIDDRVSLLHTLATRDPYPESIPINLLVPVNGTPLEKQKKISIWEMIPMIATARIIMPKAMIRLSAGRLGRSKEEQALCFLAGANSIFSGEKLLTCPNPDFDEDREMMELFKLKIRPAFVSNK